jgi:hypothetical protein
MKASVLAAVAVLTVQPAAADWTRTWVIQWNEPAFYYGGETGVDQPGTDCPAGNNPDADWKQVLIDAGYSEQEAAWLEDPTHPWQVPSQGNPQLGFRGKGKANVWVNPESAKDKGFVGVEGKVSWGLNLDGDETTGFVSPDGTIKGVDNQFYKALGCWKYFRGPPRTSYNAEVSANGLLSSGTAIVFVASGKGDDPLNDPDVRFGIYASPDGIVKDAMGNVTPGFTFRIQPSATVDAIFEARTVDGVIQSTRPAERVVLRDPTYAGATEFLEAQITFRMHPDGRLVGEVGGYRPWLPLYKRWIATGARRIELVSGAELDQA